jgi:hypothetical protein
MTAALAHERQGQPLGSLGAQSGQAIVQSTPRSCSMNFGGEAVFGERVGHGDCGSSVRSRPSWVRHPRPSSLRSQAGVLDWTRAEWFARRPFDSHASNSYLATVMGRRRA